MSSYIQQCMSSFADSDTSFESESERDLAVSSHLLSLQPDNIYNTFSFVPSSEDYSEPFPRFYRSSLHRVSPLSSPNHFSLSSAVSRNDFQRLPSSHIDFSHSSPKGMGTFLRRGKSLEMPRGSEISRQDWDIRGKQKLAVFLE